MAKIVSTPEKLHKNRHVPSSLLARFIMQNVGLFLSNRIKDFLGLVSYAKLVFILLHGIRPQPKYTLYVNKRIVAPLKSLTVAKGR